MGVTGNFSKIRRNWVETRTPMDIRSSLCSTEMLPVHNSLPMLTRSNATNLSEEYNGNTRNIKKVY